MTPSEIKAARLGLGLTIRQAASRLRVSRRAWLRWEKGESAPRSRRRRLALARFLDTWAQQKENRV